MTWIRTFIIVQGTIEITQTEEGKGRIQVENPTKKIDIRELDVEELETVVGGCPGGVPCNQGSCDLDVISHSGADQCGP